MIDPITYLAQVAWETIAYDVVKLTDTTYRVTVKPENINQVGSGQCEIGFYFKDFNGDTYLVTVINVGGIAGNIELTDSFGVGYGPMSDRTAIIYKSVGNGKSPFLAPIMYSRLDKSAFDKSRAIDLAVLWNNDPNTKKIPFTNTDTPKIKNYQADQTDPEDGTKTINYAEIYDELPKIELFILISEGVYQKRQDVPAYNYIDGLLDSIAFDALPDTFTGYLTISR